MNVYELECDVEAWMDEYRVPGVAVALVRGGVVAYARGFGVTSVEDGGAPVTPQTLFRIGSVTKGMTCAAAMRLVEMGQLDLDRPVVEYLPWLRFSEPGAEEAITPRLLMSHSAGLQTSHTPFGRQGAGALEAYVREDVPRYRFVAPPGTLYSYSNPGIRLVGYLLQVLADKPYTELMRELFFEPLGMARTTFDPTVAMTYPVAQSHELVRDGTLRVQHRYADDAGGYPSGSVISTALDLAQYARFLLGGGEVDGRRVLSAASVAEMVRPHADKLAANEAAYGLGLALDAYGGYRRVWHEGAISAFGTRLALVPAEGAAAILLFNRAQGVWDQAEALSDRLLDALLPAGKTTGPPGGAPAPLAADERARWPLYEGAYLGDWRGLAVVQAEDGALALTWNGERMALDLVRSGVYTGRQLSTGARVSVGFVPGGESGPVGYIQVNSSPCRRFTPDEAFVPQPERWARYEGRYGGVEKVAVRVVDGELLLYSEEVDREMACVPLSNTTFASDVGLVEFLPDGDGHVPALEFGRVYSLLRQAG
ncbi:MAG: beta-lactamase family protein [Anaerolineae bacterium]|nr:beta-lactamase family protein [Anaerolineae bacterium]